MSTSRRDRAREAQGAGASTSAPVEEPQPAAPTTEVTPQPLQSEHVLVRALSTVLYEGMARMAGEVFLMTRKEFSQRKASGCIELAR